MDKEKAAKQRKAQTRLWQKGRQRGQAGQTDPNKARPSRHTNPDKAARPTEQTKPGLDNDNVKCFGNKGRTEGLPARPKNRRTPKGQGGTGPNRTTPGHKV